MSNDIAKRLKGSRKDVESAAKEIEKQFKELGNQRKDRSIDATHALRLGLVAMRQICLALQEQPNKNADIFCNILVIILPHVEPQKGKPNLWDTHLTSLRYIHHALCQEQTFKECQSFYALMRKQTCHLQAETDYKLYFNIHVAHFGFLQKRAIVNSTTSSSSYIEDISYCVESLGELFEMMLKQEQLTYPNLIVQLNEQLLAKRSTSFLKSLATLPHNALDKMMNPLLKLLANNKESSPDFSEYLGAFLAIHQIDIYTPEQLEHQYGLQLLRSCRGLFKNVSYQNSAIQLFYYYIKLLYLKEPMIDFRSTYIDLCTKFVCFFEKKITGQQTKEQWFMDFIVALQRVQLHLNQSDSKVFNFRTFWKNFAANDEQVSSAETYAGHFLLLQSCVRMGVHIQGSPFAVTCTTEGCKSIRRHCIFSLLNSTINCCANWKTKEADRKNKTYHKALLAILTYGMEMAKDMKCMGPTNIDLIRFVRLLAVFVDKIACVEQWLIIEPLLEPLKQLRSLISAQDMQYLLYRLVKASSEHCPNPELAIHLQAAYIANQPDPLRRRAQLCIYYHSVKTGLGIEKCIYEWLKSSSFANTLSEAQQQQFYDMNLTLILHYFKTPPMPLVQSLIRCRRTEYHWILIARRFRSDNDMLNQCQEICNKYQRAFLTGQKQSRMENLCAGHASAHLLIDALEAQKIKSSIRDVKEIALDEFFIKNNLMDFNIQRERCLVELSVNVIKCFGFFFRQADAEPLESNEMAIDWEALVDDGIAAAVALSSMGYTQQADDAWFLLLEIGKFLYDRFTYLRALTYFLGLNRHSHVFQELQLEEELPRSQEMLDDLWPQLSSSDRFYKRHQTIVMLCLCHMATYYAKLDCRSHAQLLIMLVEDLREEFPERVDKKDIVLITLQTVKFRIVQQQKQCKNMPIMSPLRLLDTLQDSFCNFSNLSSVDLGALHLLLGDLVKESTECSSNRLTERFSFSNIMLNVAIQSGLALRSIEVLTYWLWTNLQMEDLEKAQTKLRLINHLLGIKPLKAMQLPVDNLKQIAQAKEMQLPTIKLESKTTIGKNDLIPMMQQVEPMRKQKPLELLDTPHQVCLPAASPPSKFQLQCYLRQSQNLLIQNSEQLQFIYFTIGCLHARLLFLKRESYEQLDYFYEKASHWLKDQQKQKQESLHNLPNMLHVQNMNYLRKRKKTQLAIAYGNEALKLITPKDQQHYIIDINYSQNLISQLMAAYMELKPRSPLTSSKGVRTALNFNLSPERKSQILSTLKTRTKFAIYSEKKTKTYPPSSPDDEVDLNACQVIDIPDSSDEENAAPLQQTVSAPVSVRKGRPPNRTQSKPQIVILEDQSPAKSAKPQPVAKLTRSRSAKPQIIILEDDCNDKATPKVQSAAKSTRSRSVKTSTEVIEKTPSTRPRRKAMVEQGQQLESLSSRRRQRD